MAKHFLTVISTLSFFFSILHVNAQNQSDFISIDCGASVDYTDNITGIKYTSDSNYTDSGNSEKISPEFNTSNIAPRYQNVRSFPVGKRNCYKLKPSKGKDHKYLIRAGFMYGNYDGLERFPVFDLYLGVNKWKTVRLGDSNTTQTMEIIHELRTDYLDVCLVKTGSSTPFISVLELRLLINDTYVTQSGALELFARLDCGSKSNQIVRYSEDVLDRLWTPFNFEAWDVINTSLPVEPNIFQQPSVVMGTAVTARNENGSVGISWTADIIDGQTPEFYLYLHFAELQTLKSNQTREFNIYLNDSLWFGPLVPNNLSVTTIYSTVGLPGSSLTLLINGTENSTLPPLLNALEIYSVKNLTGSETNQNDVEAISNIKLVYGVKRNSWQGDPCAPKDYLWDGLNCSYNGNNPPRIISLNLSSSGLRREISPFIAGLTMLEYLDLSNNNLSGTVPEFLSDLSHLRVLNLKGNKLKGPFPRALLERSRNGLSLSVDPDVIEDETSPPPSPPPPPPSLPTNGTSSASPSNEPSSSSHRYAFGKNKFAVSGVALVSVCLLSCLL